MISEIFVFHYTANMYPAQLFPLTRDELLMGMSTTATEIYLSLIQQLYDACAYDVNLISSMPLNSEVNEFKAQQRDRLYEELLEHLLTNDAISDETYFQLNKYMPIEFNFLEHPKYPTKYVSDSVEDFRLSFEQCILDNDPYINIRSEYLADRYGYSYWIRPEATSVYASNSDLFLFNSTDPKRAYKEISYWEANSLLKKIQHDMHQNANEQEQLRKSVCDPQPSSPYHAFSQKTTYNHPKNISEWYTIKRALDTDAERLACAEELVKCILETMKNKLTIAGTETPLYIYKGTIVCHKHKHLVVPATAILHDSNDQEVVLDVEYCSACDRYLLNYVSFNNYREKNNILIGKLKMINSTITNNDIELAPVSPLKLCGYDVSQTTGLSSSTRHFLLAKIIHEGIMSKLEVIKYLEHFINMNGSKPENHIALEKWCDDLDFVHKYNIAIQPTAYISSIKKY